MICEAVQKLLDYAKHNKLITEDDIFVVRNELMDTLQLSDWTESETTYKGETIDEILKPIIDYACKQGIITDTINSRDLFDTKLMGLLTPMPREIIAEFNRRYEVSPKEATDWYYKYSCELNYVRAGRIEKDLRWIYYNQPLQT